MFKRSLVLAGVVGLTACAGVGVMETSDPIAKLNDASYLYARQNRPLIAERLIFEAIDIFRVRNDLHGLGNAHREYATLLRSQTVVAHEAYYRKNGFWDKTVTYDNRLEKASGYLSKALGYYSQAEPGLIAAGLYDKLTNLYFNMAWVHCWLNRCRESCAYFDKALGAYEENLRRNPSAKPQHGESYSSVPQQFEASKKEAGCL